MLLNASWQSNVFVKIRPFSVFKKTNDKTEETRRWCMCVCVCVCFAFVCVCVSIHLNVIYDKQ